MNNNIFVSIASYRDDECINTLNNLYKKAKNPNSIYVGICQQNNNDIDYDVIHNIQINNYYSSYLNNIRIIRIPYYDARGPYYARYLCSSLLDIYNEKFFFQIDSHTNFIENWDAVLIDMYNEIITLGLSNKPIISYYPKDIINMDNETDEYKNKVPVFTGVIWKKEKEIFILKSALYTDTNNTYIKTPFSAAGMIFSSSSLIKEVPFNSCLTHLFDGEEIYNSIRFYLNDYDIFIPKSNIIYHEYLRPNKPKFWDEPLCKFDDSKPISIVNKFIFNLNYKEKNRTIKDFYKFADINIYDYYFYNIYFNEIIIVFISIIVIIILLIIFTPKLKYLF
jgi:hypothetical protein